MSSVSAELNSVKTLVTSVLADNPETRSNDTKLYLECCRKLGATTFNDIYEMGLSIISVHKARQVVQNKEKMYLPEPEVTENRKHRCEDVREYMRQFKN